MGTHPYELRVRGGLGPAARAAFDGFDAREAAGVTTLRGAACDQAALHAAIVQVQSLGLELLEVRRLDGDEPGRPATAQRSDTV